MITPVQAQKKTAAATPITTVASRRKYKYMAHQIRRPRVALILVSAMLGMALAIAFYANASGMPPHPDLMQTIKQSQRNVPYPLQHRAALLEKGIDNPEPGISRFANTLAKPAAALNLKILALLVDFSDKAAQVSPTYFDTLIYHNQEGSVAHYYQEISYGALSITTVNVPSAIGWKRAPQTLAYYANNANGLGSYPQNAQRLVEDVVDLVNPFVDFSEYDNDGDGYVDGLIVVHAGQGAELTGEPNDIWSHKWAIAPRLVDGVRVYAYSMEPEYWITPGDMTCGVYCHELGHIFGLPDLYDTDYSSAGVGDWSLMASGSWNGYLGSSPAHPDAWSRIALGFCTPTTLTSNQIGFSLPEVETNQFVLQLWTDAMPEYEYFLVENRQKSGYDAELPGHGLLIWHVDESRPDNDDEWWPGCGHSQHYKVALVQADNKWDLEHYSNYGDAGDPFPGTSLSRSFDEISSPNSNSYSGSTTGIAVTNISNSGALMTADITVSSSQYAIDNKGVIPGIGALGQNYPNPFNNSTEIAFDVAEPILAKVEILDVCGRLVTTLIDDQVSPGRHRIEWHGIDKNGQPASSGVYFYRLTAGTRQVCRRMALVK